MEKISITSETNDNYNERIMEYYSDDPAQLANTDFHDDEDYNDDSSSGKTNVRKTTDEIDFMNEQQDYKSSSAYIQTKVEYTKKTYDGSGDNNDDEEGDFFANRRKTNNRYFSKNTNDAIKIISTPHGKVGIVYQQLAPTAEDDANYSIEPKITPVLTSDGKVALLYRGASANTKYEPILNVTHKFVQHNDNNNKNSDADAGDSSVSTSRDHSNKKEEDEIDLGYDEDDDEPINININSPKYEVTTEQLEIFKSSSDASGEITVVDVEYENSILPNINRPLSEVLGIKKNQFTHFRISESSTIPISSTTISSANEDNESDEEDDAPQTGNAQVKDPYQYDFGLDVRTEDRLTNHLDTNRPIDDQPSIDDGLKTEVVNLAIIPHFDEEFELLEQKYRTQYAMSAAESRHYNPIRRFRNDDLSGIHCIIQSVMGLAAISTVFGMLGAFFKQRIIDRIRIMHW